MADFLSSEWFERLNEALRNAGPLASSDEGSTIRVVLEFPDAPSSGPHAMTFTISADGASVSPGDHLAADTLIRLSYSDALALSTGQIDSASALREGRIKVRGDVNAFVPLLSWLQGAHPGSDS